MTKAPARTKPAVGYIRMSSDKQEESPAQQRNEVTKLAHQHGFHIIRWYQDDAISGANTAKRKAFRQMIADASDRGDFQAILCWDQDRFGRFDSIEAGEWISPLRRARVELICVVQGRINWDDFAGRMIYQITQEGKNQFLVSLSNNVMRGMLNQARDGYGKRRSPYGYDRVYHDEAGKEMHRVIGADRFAKPKGWKAKLEPSQADDEVETVRWLFNTYATTDANSLTLARDLNARNIVTRTGLAWSGQTIRKLLANPVYIGTMIYGKTPQGRFNQVGDGHLGGDGPIVIENNHPAIIDRETFDRVQQKLESRRAPQNRPRANDYVLSGLITCGNTGGPMTGRQASLGNRVKYYSARQPSAATDHHENCYAIRQDQLEPLVIAKITNLIDTPNIKAQLRTAITKQLKVQQQTSTTDIKQLETQIAKLDKQITKGVERLLLLDDEDQADAKQVLTTWRTQRQQLQTQLSTTIPEQSQLKTKTPTSEATRIANELTKLKTTFTTANATTLRTALTTVIEGITLHWTTGGPRKWKFTHGTIHLGGHLRLLAPCESRSTAIKPTPMDRFSR